MYINFVILDLMTVSNIQKLNPTMIVLLHSLPPGLTNLPSVTLKRKIAKEFKIALQLGHKSLLYTQTK